MARKDLLARLADAGEDAIARLADTPGSDRLLGFAHNMRERMDEMQKKVRGIDELERRVAALEQQLNAQGGGPGARGSASRAAAKPKAATTARKASGAAKPAAAKAKPKPKPKAKPGSTEASRSRAASTPKRPSGSTGRAGGGSPG